MIDACQQAPKNFRLLTMPPTGAAEADAVIAALAPDQPHARAFHAL
jgi:hypothetical protein